MPRFIIIPVLITAFLVMVSNGPALSGPAPVCPPQGCYPEKPYCGPQAMKGKPMSPPPPYRPGYMGPPVCPPVGCAPPTKCAPPSCGPALVCAPPSCAPAPCPPRADEYCPAKKALKGAYDLTTGILETPFWLVGKCAKGLSSLRSSCSDKPIVCPPPYAQPISAMSPIAMTVEPKGPPARAYAARPIPMRPRPAPYVARPMPPPNRRAPMARPAMRPVPMAPPASAIQGPPPSNHFQNQGRRFKPMADKDSGKPRAFAYTNGGIFGSYW
jgi:hypothetical protein